MIETTKGYKVLDKDMKEIYGNKIGYRLNKWYKTRKNIKITPCKTGYHFFNDIRDILILYHNKEYNIYEINAKGEIIKENKSTRYNSKYVCSEIRIVRKLSNDEISKYIEDNIDQLINDKNWIVRAEVAKRGFGLDKLIDDEDEFVREEVARHGFGLDKLINDKGGFVRIEVAKHNYGLDKLINDENEFVREEVARQGFGLDKLINDEIWFVREEAYKQLNANIHS